MEVILSRLPGSLPLLHHGPLARAAPRDSLTSRQVRQSTVLLEHPQNSLRPTGVKALLSTPKGPRNNTQPPENLGTRLLSCAPHNSPDLEASQVSVDGGWMHAGCPGTCGNSAQPEKERTP